MYDYSERIESFRDQKVRLSGEFLDKLLAHRKANRDRLISRLPDEIPGLTIGESSFKPQGSVAMQTIIQTKFATDEYDIDDGVVLWKPQLVKKDGTELTAAEAKEKVGNALKDERFNRQPRIHTNCVRVFYADTDEEKHHVDFPVYRRWKNENEKTQRELAGENAWIESDPTQVNMWFDDVVKSRNKVADEWGTQFRQLIQLLKRFCRSRKDTEWDMPNGMKLTMLVYECQPAFQSRIDIVFRELLTKLETRLMLSMRIYNLAHPDKPTITKTNADGNITELLTHVQEAIAKLKELDKVENDNPEAARAAWDWIFKSDGFFKEFDDKSKEDERENARACVQNHIHTLASVVTRAGQVALSFFNVPHKHRPQWDMQLIGDVHVRGYYTRKGFRSQEFQSNSEPLLKHCSLTFEATTTVNGSFKVYWQVVNTGDEASAVGGLRGGFCEGLTERGGLVRNEGTRYKGSHWIECFIVKQGVCVARSGEFVVNIQ
jgi:hypothetical protein